MNLLEFKKSYLKPLILALTLLFLLNFLDFLNYYWFRYGEDTKHIFYSSENINVYEKMAEIAKKENLTPLVSKQLIDEKGDTASIDDFARSLYFIATREHSRLKLEETKGISPWSFINPQVVDENIKLPERSILITKNNNLNEEKLETGVKDYYLYINH